MSEDAHENLRYAEALLGHQVPAGDIAQVIERALAVYVRHLEKTKFAATGRPSAGHKPSSPASRHIPAPVRRAVWERDAAADAHVLEVVPWLRSLGFKAREARDAAELCRDMREATLEERVRVALSWFRPRGTRKVRPSDDLEPVSSGAGAAAAPA